MKKSPLLPKIVAIILAAIIIPLLILASCGHNLSAPPPRGHTIKYKILGEGVNRVNIGLLNLDTRQVDIEYSNLPWQAYNFHVESGTPLMLTALSIEGDGILTCQIWMDDELIISDFQRGHQAVVDCEGTVE